MFDVTFLLNIRWMYWTDYGSSPKIERASMDGTSRSVLHNTSLNRPYGLTLDYDTQTLYWIDHTFDSLESSNADGSNRRLLTRTNIQCPYGLTFFDERLFWGDLCQHTIYTTNINSPSSVSAVLSTINDPYRIHVISEERQPVLSREFIAMHSLRKFLSTSPHCSPKVHIVPLTSLPNS